MWLQQVQLHFGSYVETCKLEMSLLELRIPKATFFMIQITWQLPLLPEYCERGIPLSRTEFLIFPSQILE